MQVEKRHGVELRQSYARVGQARADQRQRYARAHQFKRARHCASLGPIWAGVIRDIGDIGRFKGLQRPTAILWEAWKLPVQAQRLE